MNTQYVRINMPDHPMHGLVGEVFGTDSNGLVHVQAIDSSFNGWFRPDAVQEIKIGTRILIEVDVVGFHQDSIMVAGGCVPLTCVIGVVEEAKADDTQHYMEHHYLGGE